MKKVLLGFIVVLASCNVNQSAFKNNSTDSSSTQTAITKYTNKKTITGLDWLASAQESEGYWDTGKHEGSGSKEWNLVASAHALLAFMCHGYTPRVGKYKPNMRVGLKWLLKSQNVDGSFGGKNDTSAICVLALAEFYGMGIKTKELKIALYKGVDFILCQQNSQGGFNNNKDKMNRSDMLSFGWCMMALKSSMIAGVKEKEIKDSFGRASKLLDSEIGTTGDNSEASKGDVWVSLRGKKIKLAMPGSRSQAIAMLIRLNLGWRRSEPWLQKAGDSQLSHAYLKNNKYDLYRIYFAYLGIFQLELKKWKFWKEKMNEQFITMQRLDGNFSGSWDNRSVSKEKKGGRVLSTAIIASCLDIRMRWPSVMY